MTEANITKESIKRERVFEIALGESIKYTLFCSAVVGAGTVFLTLTNLKFKKFTSISAKVSFPVMAGLFAFGLVYEKTIHNATVHPENWGLTEYIEKGKVTRSNMPYHHQVLNAIYDHPFRLVIALGTPFAAFILHTNLKLTHLTLSQKIMHSRVHAQGGILMILMTTMAFREYMNKRGRFPEPNDDDA